MQTLIDKSDIELVREYVESKSQSAFAELADRHTSWIYSCALRRVHDPHMAQDVVQAVFIILAEKSPGLKNTSALNAWLFRVTRFAANHALRTQARRNYHEGIAASMNPEISSPDADSTWRQIQPHLDDLVSRLRKDDRQALLLRFYQQKSMAEVGTAMSVSEEAAKKRVARAVERLRSLLRRNGVTFPATAVTASLIAGTTHPAPASLIASCASASTAPASAAAITIAKGAITAMITAKTKVALFLVLLAILIPIGGAATYVIFKGSDSSADFAPPPVAAATPASNQSDLSEQSKLTAEEIEGAWTGSIKRPDGDQSFRNVVAVISGNQLKFVNVTLNRGEVDTFTINVAATPHEIDINRKGEIYRGIFSSDGDHLQLCWNVPYAPRPTEFAAGAEDYPRFAVFTRQTTSQIITTQPSGNFDR